MDRYRATPCHGLYREASPKMGVTTPFSGFRYKKGRDFQVEVKNTIEVVEVYNRVGKSGIYVYHERD